MACWIPEGKHLSKKIYTRTNQSRKWGSEKTVRGWESQAIVATRLDLPPADAPNRIGIFSYRQNVGVFSGVFGFSSGLSLTATEILDVHSTLEIEVSERTRASPSDPRGIRNDPLYLWIMKIKKQTKTV